MSYETSPMADVRDTITTELGLGPHVHLNEIQGGFTVAKKYTITPERQATPLAFAKLIPLDGPPKEVEVIRTEMRNYALLQELGLTDSIFPRFITDIATDNTLGFVIGYYDNATWAGPWNETTMANLHAALQKIHTTPVDATAGQQLQQGRKRLDEWEGAQDLYASARTAFSPTGIILNSRGHIVHRPQDASLYDALLTTDSSGSNVEALIIRDANKHNICFDAEQNAHIVDPVYLDIGDPYQDFLNVAQDILGDLPSDSPYRSLVSELFIPKNRDSKALLDGIAYGLTAIQSNYDANPGWMDYQQAGLVEKLRIWDSLS